MFLKCSDIISIMEDYANSSIALDWDNVGLILGDENTFVKKILVALDIDDNVIEEAIHNNCDMIITHHPFIFNSIKKINCSTIVGRRIIKLIKNNINVYCAHTNLDIAKNGTSDTFASLIGLLNVKTLFPSNNDYPFGLGRIGDLEKPLSFLDFTNLVKKNIGIDNLSITGDLNKTIKKVAICTGSGGEPDFILQASKNKCDVYITGDVKFHNAQFARDLDICLVDASHYYSEVIIVPVICSYINNCAKKLNMNVQCIPSKVDAQVIKII